MAPRHRVEPRHIKDLIPDPANRRQHNPRNIGMLVDALQKVGASRSIVLDENDVILAGNGVVEAASEAGLTKVQIVEADGETIVAVRRRGLTDAQKRDLAIYDNRTAELATWNVEQLAADLKDGLDLAPFFFEDELKALMAGSEGVKAGLTDPDAVPQERATSIQAGDLFELGRHRLLCGDCTVQADVARLMGNLLADLVFTSPPYCQQRDYKIPVTNWDSLMEGAFTGLPAHDSTQVLVNIGLIHRDGEWIPYWDGWIEWMRQQGWRRFGWYVWDQGPGLPGDWNGRFAPAHEFVFHFNRVSRRPEKTHKSKHSGESNHGHGLRKQDGSVGAYSHAGRPVQPFKIPDSVIRVTREKNSSGIQAEHPAVFPVKFAAELLSAFVVDGGLTYEPFCGSGSAIIAAEQLNQRCFGLELESSYCQVIIDRWESFTGLKAQKVGEAIRA